MAVNKTQVTSIPVAEFLTTIEPKRASEAETIIAMMREISGLEPVMWGPSIIGFGSYHYRYASGHEGDMPILGFSPRKANQVIYLSEGFSTYYQDLLDQLGRHKTSKACLYMTRLENNDLGVLRQILQQSWDEQ